MDGANRIPELAAKAKAADMPALALTDHGVMYGAWELMKACRDTGIRPIVGMEAYVSPGHRGDRELKTVGGRNYFHLVLLAQNEVGYRNLCRLSSRGFTEGFYYEPRVDRELLERYSEGIIVTSACLASEVSQSLEADREDLAREAIQWYRDTFPDRYYLEVQSHESEGQSDLNEGVFRLAEEFSLPVVATNDVHFLDPDDHGAHDIHICIGMAKDRDDPNRLRYDDGLYFKDGDEIASAFPNRGDVIENTVDLAERCDLHLRKSYHVPSFELPDSVESEAELLDAAAHQGALSRYETPLPDEVTDRLAYELEVITGLGYSGYFLILADVIDWARKQGIPVGPGRGSAAGSIVAYCMGITDVCPLEHDLLFERFLNPSRATMPDIDVDFARDRRGEVIEYTRQKYGEDAVSGIITFSRMKARSAVKNVGRVLGFRPGEMDRLASRIPSDPNYSLSIEEASEKVPEVRELVEGGDPVDRELIEYSARLEGLARNASAHAAAVVIAPGPLEDYVPIAVLKGGTVVTQYEMNAVEEAGLLKMDYLGLKALDTIAYAKAQVRDRHRVNIAFNPREKREGQERFPDCETVEAPLDDPETYRLARSGHTLGVFQFDSSLATDTLRSMDADSFGDMVATSALIRPGPNDSGLRDQYIRRKLGEEDVRYAHPSMEEILEPTYGVLVYQEQVMRLSQKLAGYSLAEADILRKAVGKKDQALIERELKNFVQRATDNAVPPSVAEKLAEEIAAFGRYGFNAAHAVAYTYLSFQTAYLKAHFPAEFIAALLSYEEWERIRSVLVEADALGVTLLRPCVNRSMARFYAESHEGKPAVRLGLSGIKGVGSLAEYILVERESNGPFNSIWDFTLRMAPRRPNKEALRALVGSGAFDDFGERGQLLANLDRAVAYGKQQAKDRAVGQGGLFGPSEPELSPAQPVEADERLRLERETAGIYLSGHPMTPIEDAASEVRTHTMPCEGVSPGEKVTLVGLVASGKTAVSRNSGNAYMTGHLEDLYGMIPFGCYGAAFKGARDALEGGGVLVLEGRFSQDDRTEELRFTLLGARPFEIDDAGVSPAAPDAVYLHVRRDPTRDRALGQQIARTLQASPGDQKVYVKIGDGGVREARTTVKVTDSLIEALQGIPGVRSAYRDEALD